MAVNLIPNQLVKLYDTETFNQRNKRLTWDYRTYCQIVRDEQTTQFQIQVTPQTGTNLITNGDFLNGFTGWNELVPTWGESNDKALGFVGNAAYNPTMFQQFITEVNSWYHIGFEVVSFSGSSTAQLQISAADTGLNILDSIIVDRPTYGEFPGTFDLYFNSNALTAVNLIFAFDGALQDTVYVDNVVAEKLTTPVLTLVDSGGTTIETLTPFAQALDVITYEVEWAGKTEGTYKICMTGVDDLDLNYLEDALALGTEGDEPITLEQGGNLRWYG